MKSRVTWLVLLFAFAGAGCTLHHAAMPKPTSPNTDYRVSLSTQPAMTRQLDPTQFTVSVTDKAKRPVTGAQVTVQLAMPAMDMGRNEIALHEAATRPGTYTGTGRFTMPGDWQAVVAVDKSKQHAETIVSLTVR